MVPVPEARCREDRRCLAVGKTRSMLSVLDLLSLRDQRDIQVEVKQQLDKWTTVNSGRRAGLGWEA